MPCSNYCFYGCDPDGECEAWYSLPHNTSSPQPRYRYVYPYTGQKPQVYHEDTTEGVVPHIDIFLVTPEERAAMASTDTSHTTKPEGTADAEPDAVLESEPGSKPDSESDLESGPESYSWSNSSSSARAVAGSVSEEQLNLEQHDYPVLNDRQVLWLEWKIRNLAKIKGPDYVLNTICYVKSFVENFIEAHHGSEFAPMSFPYGVDYKTLPTWYLTYCRMLESALERNAFNVQHYMAVATFLYMASELSPFYADIKKIMTIRVHEMHPVGPDIVLTMMVDCNLI